MDERGIIKKNIEHKSVYVDKGDVIISKILTKPWTEIVPVSLGFFGAVSAGLVCLFSVMIYLP